MSYTPPGNTSSGACAEYSEINASPTTLISSALVPKFVVNVFESTTKSKSVSSLGSMSGASVALS